MKALLNEAIADWERFRRSQGIAKNTINGQLGILRRFMTVNGNIYVDKINDHHVTRHFEEASKTKGQAALRNDHVALSVFFDWCRHTKRMSLDSDPMYGRRIPKKVTRERNRLNVTEFNLLLDAAEARCPRDRAVIAVVLYTLLRDQEAADLRIMDVDLEGGWLRARIHKTHQEDRLPISAELDVELRRWLAEYTAAVGPLAPHYRLLPARHTIPGKGEDGKFDRVESSRLLPEKGIGPLGRMVTPILESIGFPVRDHNGKPTGEGAHTIRRSGARALFDTLTAGGYDRALRVVQSLLHHASVTQTELYLGVTADRRGRDELIRGKSMYRLGQGVSNVVPIAQ